MFTRGVVVIRIGLIMLLSGVLAACSPQYNWREIPVGQGAAKAFFPDKPATQERTLKFSGHDIAFSMTSATVRSEEHTSELQSLMRISYAVFCLKKKKIRTHKNTE